jgi:hypothetical protein
MDDMTVEQNDDRSLGPKRVYSWAEMRAAERKSIKSKRDRKEDEPWFGLALSGGGIRSATFCLGILQSMASNGVLKYFDFMSSVSGGGYTAASLEWWWYRNVSYGTSAADFPYGSALESPTGKESPNLGFLRWHASYLAPGGGISIWSGIAVLLRTLFLSLFVWLPLAIFVFLALLAIPKIAISLWGLITAHTWRLPPVTEWTVGLPYFGTQVPNFAYIASWGAILIFGAFVFCAFGLAWASILVPPETIENRVDRFRRARRCAVIGLATAGLGGFLIFKLNDFGVSDLDPLSKTVFIISAVSLVVGVISLLLAGLQAFRKLEFGANYALRRLFDLNASKAFTWFIVCGILTTLPIVQQFVREYISHASGTLLGISSLISGISAGLYGHFVQAQRVAPRYAFRLAATVAAGIFLYSMILLSYTAACVLLDGKNFGISPANIEQLWEIYPAVVVFSILFGASSNLNHLGLHRFYRDRLMEAFLPTNPKNVADKPEYTDADRVSITSFWDDSGTGPNDRPYLLVNTNAILINDSDPELALRGGDSFILSPLFVGSKATGWSATSDHIARHGPLTLASAMAASGAAANANAAYIGSGITRDRLISVVMTLLNMRLGVWLNAPKATAHTPNYFSPGFKYGVLGGGYKSESDFVELTDGGHFDNLGVYELIRRRVDVIVALDSEEDPSTAMSALGSMCQRVQDDFDVTIEIGDLADKIVPGGDLGYPPGSKFSGKSFFVAKIFYPKLAAPYSIDDEGLKDAAEKLGTFVYIKSNMIKGLSFPVKGYKAKNPDFPNQSTMDQFFEPAQFEAYRELGYKSFQSLIDSLTLTNPTKDQLCGALARAIQ